MNNPLVDEDGFRSKDLSDYLDVSRETFDKINIVVEVLDKWRKTHNLIGPLERNRLWRRHILDSLQVYQYRSDNASKWIDLGSGAGFPALIMACASGNAEEKYTLVESNGKKCAFLRAAARAANLNISVENSRIESVSRETYDHVTSRALASLPQLYDYSERFLANKASCIFLKGKEVLQEIEIAQSDWEFDYELHESFSHTEGRILVVKGLNRRNK
ncbi:16S rRNA (guanine(527)-N(7))-methyltransferase RsmG [Hirschia baltica]|uniref:Ribosomal RNA small subunit methyltransferase G n=1 Tax=Hirschia baltica (strain ATCC 49814 / DSM 5838 / IFAM 1418) TaxID=582402 RepID=C6XKA6_HIRBI|nr:16S rRNA (guanine(527)-N(7))-methyltransferase RsmG [Hirschia baltica]ACT57704.1 methyltransferase GidB [Hirschia baltica ATCC 49814]